MHSLISPGALNRLLFLLVAVFLCSCREPSFPPRIDRTEVGVEGFDLVFEDSEARAEFGLFELGYAIKANYGYFTYRGKIYRSVGGGSVLIRPITNSPATFVVRETAQAQNENGSVRASFLQILDKRNGQELAHRSLVAHTDEDGSGWVGDHAVKFVRKVLGSPQAPGRPLGVADYRPAAAQVELMKAPDASPYPIQEAPKLCPANLRIVRKSYSSILAGESFEFLPNEPLQMVACDSGRVLVLSGIYASDFNFDLLSLNGDHIAQGHVRLPLPLGARWVDLNVDSLDGTNLRVTLFTNMRSDFKSDWNAHALLHIDVTRE